MVRNINFSVYEGEIVGFAGLMGAGRTETTRRSSEWMKRERRNLCGRQAGEDQLSHGCNPKRSCSGSGGQKEGRSVHEAEHPSESGASESGSGMQQPGRDQQQKEEALCEKAVKDLLIKTPNVEIDSGNLSGGNQQKVVVGKWLARNSRVVIFDEPTRGIDVGAKVEIYNLMNELKQQGIAVMFVSSEMPEVMGIADRIVVMCDGRITGEGYGERDHAERDSDVRNCI